ncbi:hypothetical protein PCH_Pc06g01720 [Penicillium rubens Wisconsin 54-1255]|uniref:Uncharacterized protein n=1 Tax=Penicillium rubens (strain ATCC 28089 / DSM 1075 / NRRL 1951 / Wisconsin 54-1255) TaxID=500485 RepID=B6GWE2_PENRW|nr:hypothetical protein PCH_Pc06g01720 [Penicillium rubens Wisconsin 54-1255]
MADILLMGLGSVGEFLTSSADSNVLRSLLEGLKNHKSTIQKYILPGTSFLLRWYIRTPYSVHRILLRVIYPKHGLPTISPNQLVPNLLESTPYNPPDHPDHLGRLLDLTIFSVYINGRTDSGNKKKSRSSLPYTGEVSLSAPSYGTKRPNAVPRGPVVRTVGLEEITLYRQEDPNQISQYINKIKNIQKEKEKRMTMYRFLPIGSTPFPYLRGDSSASPYSS